MKFIHDYAVSTIRFVLAMRNYADLYIIMQMLYNYA